MPTFPLPHSSLLSARLRVGECTVDMPLREIHAPSARRPRRVTPKAIAVLAALIEQGGRVVSREDHSDYVALEVELPGPVLASLHAYRAAQATGTRVLD